MCGNRKPAGSRQFYSVAPLLLTFVISGVSHVTRQERSFTDCGNPNGRPRALKYTPPTEIARHIQRDDFFEVDNAPITISENGKRRQISVRKAIYQKLAYSAASGNTRAAVEWNKMRTRFVCEYIDEQMSLLAQVFESEKVARHRPEDVTDKFLETLRI